MDSVIKELPSPWWLAIPVTVGYFIYLIVTQISTSLQTREFIHENGCRPAASEDAARDPIMGLDRMAHVFKEAREGHLQEYLRSKFENLGPTYISRTLMDRATFTIDSENVKAILATNFNDYSVQTRATAFGRLMGVAIFSSDGDAWVHSRAMLRPSFTRDQVANLDLTDKHILDLLGAVVPGANVDLKPLLFDFTLDSATEFFLGHSTNALDKNHENETSSFGRAFDVAVEAISREVRLVPFSRFMPHSKEVKESYRICRSHARKFVEDAISKGSLGVAEENKGRRNFILELASTGMNTEKVTNEVIALLTAGRDTTSALLSNFFFLVARRPDVWSNLRAGATRFGEETPSYEQLRDLKYTRWCVNEALRLYPPIAINSRTAVRDTVLPRGGGRLGDRPLHVPKGSRVMWHSYSLHRRKEVYGDDAHEFRPERWETLRPSWDYIPFHGGPRICLGQQYALTETFLVIVRFAQAFARLESRDSRPFAGSMSLSLASANGVHVTFHKDA
ncbi:n-alkane-inducible cytochrome P450 [Thozetella sp. PMI_491]|nr:n-alkane-inducible cytochrome P450 [Thozetella sp. PMI_491]